MKKFSVCDLFAGVGGISLGFKNAIQKDKAYELVFANEIDKYASETYRMNFDHYLLEGDIYKFLDPNKCTEENEQKYYMEARQKLFQYKIDVLTGGFPCQAFSIAGERKGFADDRGNLFLAIIELIKQLEKHSSIPRILFLENVKNLMSHDNKRTYKIIKRSLEDCGYIIKEKIINTMNFSSVPQNRERIYIVGFINKDDADRFTLFDHLNLVKKNFTKDQRENQIKNILENIDIVSNKKYYYTSEKYPNYFSDKNINLDKEITESYQFYQCRRGMYVRQNKSNVCPTLTANMGMGGHNVPLIKVKDGIRKITPAEAFKLQGFPINESYFLPTSYKGKAFADSRLYKQAGNSVTVPIITLIASEILKILD